MSLHARALTGSVVIMTIITTLSRASVLGSLAQRKGYKKMILIHVQTKSVSALVL